MTKENATKDDVLVNVGDVVHDPLDVVNQKRVYYVKNITAVVVEVLKSGQSRCACVTDVFYRPYAKHNITPLQGTSNNQKLCGLREVFLEWQGISMRGIETVTKREAVRKMSLVGEKGVNVSCNYKGKCENKPCKCKTNVSL